MPAPAAAQPPPAAAEATAFTGSLKSPAANTPLAVVSRNLLASEDKQMSQHFRQHSVNRDT